MSGNVRKRCGAFWCQQEFGIAAALSGDALMREAYASGDPYLAFAKQAGAVPPEATKRSHKRERDLFKACVLAVQYGMGEAALAERIGQPVAKARELLGLHRQTYRAFWAWSDAALDYAMLEGELWTVFGWHIGVEVEPNPRSLRNFPMQANGAEMLRLACCLIGEAGIRLCAPVNDAVLIEAPLETLDETVTQTQALMAEASRVVLDGFVLRTDAELVRHTCAAWLVQDGVDIRVVCELPRHSSITVTMRYAHLSSRNVREVVQRLSQFRPTLDAGDKKAAEMESQAADLEGCLVGAAGFEPATPAV